MNDFLISRTAYSWFMYAWMGIGICTFFYLLKVPAPYGRHTTAKWGPQISNRLGWILMEFPVMVLLLYFVFNSFEKITLPVWVMIGFFLFHYINRTFIFPFRLKTKGKKMPLIIVGSAILFNLVNGSALGYYFAHFAFYQLSWLKDIRFISGFMLFATGIYINWKSDNILIHLRKDDETHYVIPRGWLFDYISCPNLFGELLEWAGFALLCWNLPAFSFFIWTTANLLPRAIAHHKWYRKQFPDYPKNRKAVIPVFI